MIYEFLGLLVESYGTWLLLQRLGDTSKDSDIPKNVPFAFAINNRNISPDSPARRLGVCLLLQYLLQSCSRGGGGGMEDMCYERLRAEAGVN